MQRIKKLSLFLVGTVVLTAPLMFVLTSCTPIDGSDAVNQLLPNIYVLLTHIFACICLFTMAMWLVWKPTKNSLEKRRAYIANEIAEAEKARKEAFVKLNEAEATRLDAHRQAKLIVENATTQAYLQKETIENEGKIVAKKLVDDAQMQMVRLEQSIKQQNEKQVLDIAFSATEALLQKKITKHDNEKFISDFITKVSKGQIEQVKKRGKHAK